MRKLKQLSAREIITLLQKYDFQITHQKGSHIKLKRFFLNKSQILIIPNHKNLKKGTLKALYNQIGCYLSKSEIDSFFYSK